MYIVSSSPWERLRACHFGSYHAQSFFPPRSPCKKLVVWKSGKGLGFRVYGCS